MGGNQFLQPNEKRLVKMQRCNFGSIHRFFHLHYSTFEFSKLRTCNNSYILACISYQKCVTNVSSSVLEIIDLSKNKTKRNYFS